VIRVLRVAAAALVLATAGGLAGPAGGIVQVDRVRAAATDLTLVTDAVYTVKPGDREVGIAVSITATNHTRETRTRRTYFNRAYLAVQAGTTGFRLSGAKGATVKVARRSKDSTLLRLDFGTRLYSGDSRDYRLTFTMLGSGRSANSQTRVGSTLVTVPLWAYASNGARGSTVAVVFPEGWEVGVQAGSMPIKAKGPAGASILRSGPIAAPLTWFAYVVGQRDAVYKDRSLKVETADATIPLVVRAWVDDTAWAKRTTLLFRRALPVLHKEIGLAWPHDEPMIIQEAVNRADGAVAGLYDPAAGRIEVAYWADDVTALHEAAHAWFNGALLADRWANEGFAALYAHRAALALDVAGKDPKMTKAAEAAAIPLNAWPLRADTAGNSTVADLEAYGYAASFRLAQEIADRAGDEALRRVWADAAAGRGAYQPPVIAAVDAAVDGPASAGPTEGVDGPPDWRGLLDLLEDETGASFADLWRTWVVRPEEAALLDARARARVSYQRTLALAGDWQLPRSIRDALRAWQFDDAEQLMADARTVLAQQAALAKMAAATGVELPDSVRPAFEDGRLADASAEADAERTALLGLDRATAARSDDPDVLTQLGMLGHDPEADLAAAGEALSSGDLEAARAAADDAYRAWSDAWSEGRRRAMLVLAGLATALVVASAISGVARRRSKGAHEAAPGGPGSPG
jgi:hypothetical protein